MTTANKICKRPEKPFTAVDLAKDVLRLLKAKKFIPESMVYMTIPIELVNKFGGQSLQDVMKKKRYKPCTVCALGSLFLAHIDKFNEADIPTTSRTNYRFGDQHDITFNNQEYMISRLSPFFTKRQLLLIEHAFEGRKVNIRPTEYIADSPDAINAAEYFHKQYKTPKKRLEAIMRNIIKNDGKFRPQPAPVIYE